MSVISSFCIFNTKYPKKLKLISPNLLFAVLMEHKKLKTTNYRIIFEKKYSIITEHKI